MATILIGTNRPPCPARLYGYGTKNGQTCFTYMLCCTLISLDHHHHKHTYANRTYIHIPNTHTRTQIIGGWIEARDRKFANTPFGAGGGLGAHQTWHTLAGTQEGMWLPSQTLESSLQPSSRDMGAFGKIRWFPFRCANTPFFNAHTHCTHRNAR